MIALNAAFCGCITAASTGDALNALCQRLVNDQLAEGYWFGEDLYAGSTVPGLVEAYKRTCRADVLSAAAAGGDFIIQYNADSNDGNYLGDEAYALVKLAEVSDDPEYLAEVENFYSWVSQQSPGGTQAYVDQYENTYTGTAVFYMSCHVIAAYRVDAVDKSIWRQKLRYFLAQVNDTDYSPVMSLGAATWALAQTAAGLDPAVPVIPAGKTGNPFWNGVMLSDLPGIISSLQVTTSFRGGAFYDRLQPSSTSAPQGFTEDAAFCALALVAARENSPSIQVTADMNSLHSALLSGVYYDTSSAPEVAIVYGNIWNPESGDEYYFYSAEMLMALSAMAVQGDADMNDIVDHGDLQAFAVQWLSGCQSGCCFTADFDSSGSIDLADFALLAKNWMSGY